MSGVPQQEVPHGRTTPPDMRTRSPLRHYLGFSLLEAIVAVSVIGVVLAILLPTLQSVRGNADNLRCIANLRQLGNAGLLFTMEHNGFLPDAGRWFSRTANDKFSLLPYLGMPPGRRTVFEPSPLLCPSAHASRYRSSDVAGWCRTYGLNLYAMGSHDQKPDIFAKTLASQIPVRFQSIPDPAQMALFMDGSLTGTDSAEDQGGTNVYGGTQNYTTIFPPLTARGSASRRTPYIHNDSINVFFMDGAVRSISRHHGEAVLGGAAGAQRHPFWGAGVQGSSPSGHPLNPNPPTP